MWEEMNTGLGWTMKLVRYGDGQMAKLITGSTWQGLRSVHFWTAQISAVQNVRGTYPGSAANPPDNKQAYSLRPLSLKLEESCVKGCYLLSEIFIKTWRTNFYKFSKHVYGTKEREIPGKSASWTHSAVSWKYCRLIDSHVNHAKWRRMTTKPFKCTLCIQVQK